MSAPFSVLVIEDEELYAQAIGRELRRRGIAYDLAFSGKEGLAAAARGSYRMILLDHRLPDDDGIRLVPLLLAKQPGASIVVMTAYQAIAHAVEAIRQGADDYVVKETSVLPIVERAVDVARRAEARDAAPADDPRGDMPVGRSPALRQAVEQLRRIAASPQTTVLITGETGAGKEVAARYLHAIGSPEGSPFVTIDCMTVPANLAESLLFGHEKGAFTGADDARDGAFAAAGAGTIFLDEIGDIGPLQGKLLRVLETRTFQRLGSLREQPLRARVVAATNRGLEALVREGSFRRDLYERLSAFPIDLPPLRERREDVEALAEHFRAVFSERLGKPIRPLDATVMGHLIAYPFPGNVRELRNVIERAVILADSDRIEPRHLPERVLFGARGADEILRAPGEHSDESLEAAEARLIRQAMRRSGNVKAQAARLLGISRFRLLRRMEKHGIE
jgi:two-component system NtrC family response regulator